MRIFALGSRILGIVTASIFLIVAYSPVPDWLSTRFGTPSRIEPCDAAVVLGKSFLPQGTLGDASLRRSIAAIELHQRGLAHYILFLGADYSHGKDEAHARAEMARTIGVPDRDILIDASGRTTGEESEVARRVLAPKGISRILLITDSQHMTRAASLFRKQGFAVFPDAVDDYPNPADGDPDGNVDLLSHVTSELLARAYGLLRQ